MLAANLAKRNLSTVPSIPRKRSTYFSEQEADTIGVTEAHLFNELFKGLWASSQVRKTPVLNGLSSHHIMLLAGIHLAPYFLADVISLHFKQRNDSRSRLVTATPFLVGGRTKWRSSKAVDLGVHI